ncbi:hypothetical protein H0H92_013826 [Tricholoma furcatifolium]|nr:hypothetical protein H0H92_013826 [Tricholoma furcatifolium]
MPFLSGLRELVVSPVLVRTLPWPQYARRRHEDGISDPNDPPPVGVPTWSDLRKHNTLDSGLSGAITGGALRGWRSGPRAILPGALTIGAVCTLLQLAYNEASIRRVRYISSLKVDFPADEAPKETPASRPLADRIFGMLGVHQVTDKEYLEKMKAKRDGYLQRIAELEKQLAEEKEGNGNSKDS